LGPRAPRSAERSTTRFDLKACTVHRALEPRHPDPRIDGAGKEHDDFDQKRQGDAQGVTGDGDLNRRDQDQ
jgi:hypothetical protein